VGPEHWLAMAEAVKQHYDSYDGFVITHGTDTMAYTASALSYLIQNTAKPIVLTGSQKSIYNRDTDARNNLLRAFAYASAQGAWGVQIVFDNKVILGTRARKVRSKSFDAFSSIDYPETAVFRDSRLIFFMPKPAELPPVQFYSKLDPSVFVLRLVPGISAEIFGFLKPMFRAVIIEGFGVGGLPDNNDGAMLKAVTDWTASGRIAVFSTQVQHEGSDLGIYEVGRIAKELPGVLEAHDMTPEAAVTKLMWVLGQTQDRDTAQKMFTTPIQHDLL
jgi:L-asparaginase